jgi:hypothetical protein
MPLLSHPSPCPLVLQQTGELDDLAKAVSSELTLLIQVYRYRTAVSLNLATCYYFDWKKWHIGFKFDMEYLEIMRVQG